MRKIDDTKGGSGSTKFKALVKKAKDKNVFTILAIFIIAVLLINTFG